MDLFKKAEIEILHREADYYFKTQKYKTALSKYLTLLKYSVELHEDYDAAFYHERVGDCYEKLPHKRHDERVNDHEKAGEHYAKSAELYYGLGNHEKAGEIYEKGANTFEELNEYGKAADFYVRSGRMFTAVK